MNKMFFNIINAGLALGAIPAIIIGATSVTVVLAIVGVITAFIFYIIADPPVLNFLEKTVWSRQNPGGIKLEETIDGFYRHLYGSLEISYNYNEEFKEYSYFEIHFNGLNDDTRLYIRVRPKGVKDNKGNSNKENLKRHLGRRDYE